MQMTEDSMNINATSSVDRKLLTFSLGREEASQTPYRSEEFDFQSWVKLAQDNPEAFEQLRQKRIEEAIRHHPGDQFKLRGLQWRIDAERGCSATPLKSCIRLTSQMWDSFYMMRDKLNDAMALLRNPQVVQSAPNRDSALVLPFRKARDHLEGEP